MPEGNTGLNPLTAVDTDVEDEAFQEVRGRAESAIERVHGEALAQMERIIGQATNDNGDFDLMRCDALEGNTPKDKADSVVKLHSKLSGFQKALTEVREIKGAVDRINRRNRDQSEPDATSERDLHAIFHRPQAVQLITDRVEERLRALAINDVPGLAAHMDQGGTPQLTGLSETVRGTLDHIYDPQGATLTLSNADPAEMRLPRLVPSSQRPAQVLDLFPEFRVVDSDTVEFLQESTFTNTAAGVADGAAAPEGALAFTLKSERCKRIAIVMPVTEAVLMDIGQMGNYLNQRLPFMVMSKTDAEVTTGDGSGESLTGLKNIANTQNVGLTTAIGSGFTKLFQELYEGMRKVSTGGGYLMPSGWIFENKMWILTVTQETSSAGFYYGPPGEAWAERLFGLPVRITSAISYAASTKLAFCCDFSTLALATREGFAVDMGRSGTDYAEFQYTIRAWNRCALIPYNPKGIVSITTAAANNPA